MGLFGNKKTKDVMRAVTNPGDAIREAALERAGQMMAQGPGANAMAQAEKALAGRPGAAEAMQMLKNMGNTGMGMPSSAGTPGSATWMDAILHPQSDFARQATCGQCGGPKRLPSVSAYMYCDYCSALVDYDLRLAIRGTSQITDPAKYAATFNGIGKASRELKAAGDRDGYLANRREFWDAWLTWNPKASSHRIGDPAYRTAYVEYMAASNVVTDLDPSYQATEESMKQAVLGLRRTGIGMMIETDSLWPVLDTYMHQRQIADALLKAAGIPEQDPDHASDEVRERISKSAMAQGWLTSISPEGGEELISRLGLNAEYKKLEPVEDGQTRHCGQCGHEFTSLPGAKEAICDGCGHKLDIGSAEWPCGSCGGLMTMPAGATETTCPYCKELVTRAGR